MTSSQASLAVNNEIYDRLGERWYTAEDDPIALLRAESRLRNPWVAAELSRALGERPASVLDVGCGAGFLANYLGSLGHNVVGLDASLDALAVGKRYDPTGRVNYQPGDALHLPFAEASFDAVCAMDFLEHVEDPERVIAEAARALKPGGLFFFHTFNRSFLSWLIVIKGVEWFVRNTPVNLHILRLFIKPSELRAACAKHGLTQLELQGMRPRLGAGLLRLLLTRRVSADFSFVFTQSTAIGFAGVATKRPAHAGCIPASAGQK